MTTINEEYLRSLADELARTVTHPHFLQKVVELREKESFDDQYAVAKEIDREHLAQAGVQMSERFRVTPRTFEDPRFAGANGVQQPGCEPGSDKGSVDLETYDRSSWPGAPLEGEPAEMNDPEVIAHYLKEGIYQIIDFVVTEPFKELLAEMAEVPPPDRPKFVLEVVLDDAERAKRGIRVPDHMTIQRSTFHDGRPTLFCVSALTPLTFPWRKVTVTFDNRILESSTENHGAPLG